MLIVYKGTHIRMAIVRLFAIDIVVCVLHLIIVRFVICNISMMLSVKRVNLTAV